LLKAYKYRIYPTKQQAILLDKHFGCCRLIYNLALETKINAYQSNKVNFSKFDLIKQITGLKQDYSWLKEISIQSLQQSICNLDVAYQNFFRTKRGFPKFKKKNGRQSFKNLCHVKIDFETSKVRIPKFQDGIKFALDRYFDGQIKQATVSRVPSGKYFISILVDNKQEPPSKVQIKEETTIGIDLGINSLLTLSDGTKFDNPKYLNKSMKRLKFLQRKHSNHRGKRTKRKITLLHEHITNQRKDNLHKISMKLIRDNQSIALEDLNIKGMSSKCKPKQGEDNGTYLPNGQSSKSGLNRSIQDAGWSMFVSMLEYKANWYGKNILKIDKFEPSSKTCSGCGFINQDLGGKREWKCPSCGIEHDRDVNAGINIKNMALSKNKTVCGVHTENQKELPGLLGAMTSETHKE
jgi:putative transposase